MKVLLFIKGLGLGGAERHVVDLALGLKRRGHNVIVFYMLSKKAHFVQELQAAGINARCVGFNLITIFQEVYRFKPDIVHSHLPIPSVYARLLKLFVGFRLVSTYHNVAERQRLLVRLLDGASYLLDDCSIACSAAVARSMHRSSTVIPNGIHFREAVQTSTHVLRERLGFQDDIIVCICVANLVPKKNHELLIEAFDTAYKKVTPHVDCALVLVGQDGTERLRLERLADTKTSRERIVFWGPHPQASSLLSETDIFCLSSNHEGLPLALLESMGAGVPAVVTNVGGMPDVVVDGETGFITKAGSKEEFSNALTKLLQDSSLRHTMGNNARHKAVDQFGFEPMLNKVLHCYNAD